MNSIIQPQLVMDTGVAGEGADEFDDLHSLVNDAVDGAELSLVDRASLLDLARGVANYVRQEVDLATETATATVAGTGRCSQRRTISPAPLPHINSGVAQGIVLRVTQQAGNWAWLRFLERTRIPEEAPHLLPELSIRVMITSQDLVVRALQEHSDCLAPSTSALRGRVLDRLLAGEPANEAAERLGLRLATGYVVVGMTAGTQRMTVARSLAFRSDIFIGQRERDLLLLVPAPEGATRQEAKVIAERPFSGDAGEACLGTVRAIALAPTRDAIPRAASEVGSLLRVARALDCPPSAYGAEDLSIEMALLRSPDLADVLAQRLTPLHASGAPLVETLCVYLAQSQDRRQASKALHIHPNTLDYRLCRLKELTGLSPTVPRDIQVLGAALTAWQLTHIDERG